MLIQLYGDGWIFFLLIPLCVLFGIMTVCMYKSEKKALQACLFEERLKEASKQLETQLLYYEALMDEVKNSRKQRHDYLNYFNTLLSLLKMQEISEAQTLLQQVADRSIALGVGYCHNLVVDSILTANKLIAEELDIEYIIDVILEDNIEIARIDLCSLFANILDNAITACKTVDSGRLIMLSAAVKSGCLIIRCKNTKANDIKLDNNKRLLSSKAPSPDHGLGIAILDGIACEYDGSLNITYDKEFFQVTVFLMCGAESALFE